MLHQTTNLIQRQYSQTHNRGPEKSIYAHLLYMALSALIPCLLLGCTSNTESPNDMPISEYIIGNWKVLSVIDTKSGANVEIIYPFIFINAKTISYGEVVPSEYYFIEENTIYINNQRVLGGETWHIERNGENLIIYQEILDYKSTVTAGRDAR
jgi:hypothetical protein